MNKILITDIETTNMLLKGGSIVEIGVVSLDLDNGDIKELYQAVCREEILTAKHREEPFGWIFRNSDLTIEDVRNGRPFAEVKEEVQALFDQYPLGNTAYNKKFDFDFLNSRKITFKQLPCLMHLCTDICKIPNPKFMGYKWPKAQEAFDHFFPDYGYVEKHRGLDDAKHEAMIAWELYKLGILKIK